MARRCVSAGLGSNRTGKRNPGLIFAAKIILDVSFRACKCPSLITNRVDDEPEDMQGEFGSLETPGGRRLALQCLLTIVQCCAFCAVLFVWKIFPCVLRLCYWLLCVSICPSILTEQGRSSDAMYTDNLPSRLLPVVADVSFRDGKHEPINMKLKI